MTQNDLRKMKLPAGKVLDLEWARAGAEALAAPGTSVTWEESRIQAGQNRIVVKVQLENGARFDQDVTVKVDDRVKWLEEYAMGRMRFGLFTKLEEMAT